MADLGKHNHQDVTLSIGDKIEISGDQKPSELKVIKLIQNGREVSLQPKPEKNKSEKHAHDQDNLDPQMAIDAAAKAGLKNVQEPVRKPKHLEISGTDEDGKQVTLHIGANGSVKTKS